MHVPSLLLGYIHNPLSFMGEIFHRAFRSPDYLSVTGDINRAEMKQIIPPLRTQQKRWAFAEIRPREICICTVKEPNRGPICWQTCLFLKSVCCNEHRSTFFHITLYYMQEVSGLLPLKTKNLDRLIKKWKPTDMVLTVCCVSFVCSFAWRFMYLTFSYSRDQFSNWTVTVLQVGLFRERWLENWKHIICHNLYYAVDENVFL